MAGRTMVVFNTPVEEHIAGPEPVERGANMDHAAIQELVAEMRKVGLGDHAIVVRRNEQLHAMRQANNWGLVRDMRTFRSGVNGPYIPLLIVWLKDGFVTQEWPDAVVVVHPALEWQEMDKRLKAQL